VTRGFLLAAAACVLAAVAVLAVRRSDRAAESAPAPLVAGAGAEIVLLVPRATRPIVLDGHLTDPAWLEEAVRTRPFVESGGSSLGHQYSEARFLWREGQLYVGLYASDEDIRASHDAQDSAVWRDDSFRLAFDDGAREYLFDVSALGVVADGVRTKASSRAGFDYAWNSRVRVEHELEGTPNDPSNNDEEWVIEMAIPLASLGQKGARGERLGMWVSRCDTAKGQRRTCADWGRTHGRGVLVLD
jgi:cellulose/xylan binding protein with CBM9 domain